MTVTTNVASTSIQVVITVGGGGSMGPLRVLASNPLYFATPNGKAVYLTGNHTWTSGQSFSSLGHFSFTSFVDYLKTLDVNLIRHWDVWMETVDGPWHNNIGAVSPLPFNRSSTPGAFDGNKFDLTSYNQTFFDALKADAQYAASKGMYLMVMLFCDRQYGTTQSWATAYWNGVNNINGTTTDYNVIESLSAGSTTTNLQKAYVHKVLDTLRDEQNVLYELANEPDSSGYVPWANTMASEIRSYESANGYLQHPVGAEFVADSDIVNTTVDFIAWNNFNQDPPVNNTGKPIFTDTDHYFGIGGGTAWWWAGFMLGNNMLSMDDMERTGLTGNISLAGQVDINGMLQNRVAITQTRALAKMVDLTTMVPHGDLSSTGQCLADTVGSQYIVYAGSGGNVTVNLSAASGVPLMARWLNVINGSLSSTTNLRGGSSSATFTSPFGGTSAALVVTP